MSHQLRRVILVAAVVLALGGLWSAASTPSSTSVQGQVREVAQSLRCPTCAGEDVADSAAPLATAMRAVVADQLAAGSSPDEVRAWFAQRYGDEVLLDPPRRGAGWLLWTTPLVLAGGAALWAARRPLADHRGAAVGVAAGTAVTLVVAWAVVAGQDASAPTQEQAEPMSVVPLLHQAVAGAPGDADLRLALGRALDDEDRTAEAVEHYEAAARLRPLDADVTYLHAFALVRTGEQQQAVAVLEDAVMSDPEHSPSLLLLGTMLWRAGEERGEPLLRRFLDSEPEHPAAPEVRQLLSAGAQP